MLPILSVEYYIAMKYFMNILLRNRNHIQLVIFFAYEWNGNEKKKMMKMAMIGLKNSFQWKTLTSNVGQL